MKKNSLILTLSLTISSSYAFAQNSEPSSHLKFSELPKLVREKNEKVQASESLTLAAKKRTGFLTRSFLPGISLRAGNETAQLGSATSENRNNWSADAQLNLYRGGRDKIEEKIRESNVQLSEGGLKRDFQSELKDARKIYWQIIANNKILLELNDALKNNKDNIQSAKRRSGAGVATNADAVQFELENTLLTQQIKKLTLELDLLRNQLSIALGVDSLTNISLDQDFPHPPENLAPKASAEVKNPDTEVLKQEAEIHALKKDQSARWWIPSLDLYATYRRPTFFESDSRALAKENEWATGIMLSMNLGEGFEQQANKSAEALEAKAASQRLTYSIRQAYATRLELTKNLALLHELIHTADDDIQRSANFLKLTKSEYARGVKNGPDLQDAFAKYYEFRTRQIELYRLYNEAEADLSYQSSLDNNEGDVK